MIKLFVNKCLFLGSIQKGNDMAVFRFLFLCSFPLMVLSGCGDQDVEPIEEVLIGELTLQPSDTIGVELGDSNYVFGSIGETVFDSHGNVLVLDETAACVRIFTPDGEFLRQIGSKGSGPGELLTPGGLTVISDGTILIMDGSMGGVHAFDPEGEWLGLVTDYQGQGTPQWAWPVDDNAYVAALLDFRMEEEGPILTLYVGRFEGDPEPVVVYHQVETIFDPSDITALVNTPLLSVSFAADPQGNVYVAPVSTEEMHVNIYDRDGNLTSEFTREYPRVMKTEQELVNEQAMMTEILRERGVPGDAASYQPDPYRWIVPPFGLGIDGQGRIWAQRGTEEEITFDLFDVSGEFLRTVKLEGYGASELAVDFVSIKVQPGGILAFPMEPSDYPKVLVYEIPE